MNDTTYTLTTYTLAEIADILKLSYQKVYRMARKGEIRTVRFGDVYRVTNTELLRLLGQTPQLITEAES